MAVEQELTMLVGEQPVQDALIYCRVSSTRQRREGGGLDSQEHRCRQYADGKGYHVVDVFADDITGGGDFMKRPGIKALLAHLEANPHKSYIVIFDDLKRLARDTRFHWDLRDLLSAQGVTVECPNFRFENTPEGEFIETILAAQAELERKQNRRQVIQKMKARVEAGFWVFRAPFGYRYEKAKGGGGKILVPDENLAPVVKEALESYANGRFASQAEVQRFLERDPFFPKDRKDGTLRPMTVTRLLKKVVYAGYVEAPKWDVSLRKGQHPGLIDFETHQRILDNLEGNKRAPARKDFNEDFPLRGFVLCDDCGNAMTSAWSKGCRKHYAYYLCQTRGCASKGKSVPRAKMEDSFGDILKSLVPSKPLISAMKAMVKDAWDMRLAQARERKAEWARQIKETEKQIEGLVDRLVETSSQSVVAACEGRIEKLERQKILLTEKAEKTLPAKGQRESCIELALQFLTSPWEIYKNGSYAARRSVLKLAFVEPVRYSRNEGYRTINSAFPFKMLKEITDPNGEMVLLERIELSTSPLPRECSTSELQQRCGRVIRLKRNGAQGSLDGFFRLL